MLYDLREQNFGDDARYGRPYILVQKAKDYCSFMASDRDGVRTYFEEAIEGQCRQNPIRTSSTSTSTN